MDTYKGGLGLVNWDSVWPDGYIGLLVLYLAVYNSENLLNIINCIPK